MPSPTPRDAGRRVVVRYRLAPATGRRAGDGPTATDVIGVLLSWEDGVLRLRPADGAVVEVAESTVVAARVVPARPVPRRDVRALEAAAALAWRADEEERLGGWLLRAAGGFTGRANSCLPLGPVTGPLPVAVAAVEAWYGQRGLPPRFQVPEPLGADLTAHLDAAGWERLNPVLVLTADLPDLAAAVDAAQPDADPAAVHVSPAASPEWLATYHYRGSTLPPGARSVLERGDTLGFASIRAEGGYDEGGWGESGRTVAVARGAVTEGPDGRVWLGVTAVEVAPEQRRRGLGTAVLGGLTRWARDRGAGHVYLQVAEENAAARAAYERLGLAEHHRYHYRRRR